MRLEHLRITHLLGSTLIALMLIGHASNAAAQAAGYVVGPQDVLSVTVWGQPSLTGRYSIQADGTFAFPLIGRISAAGLSVEAVEAELRRRLVPGYVLDPNITVSIDEYRSQRIFVMGEVRQPGAYPLARETSLIEALARAGSTTVDAANEIVLVRPSGSGGRAAPTMPDQAAAAEVLHIDLKDLQTGKVISNPALRDGDTIFVPRGGRIYIFGHVRTPGSYASQRNMTVIEALAIAGGVTDRGALNRVRISRTVDGKKREIGAKLTDPVQPDDTIIVPERFF